MTCSLSPKHEHQQQMIPQPTRENKSAHVRHDANVSSSKIIAPPPAQRMAFQTHLARSSQERSSTRQRHQGLNSRSEPRLSSDPPPIPRRRICRLPATPGRESRSRRAGPL